MTRGGVQDFAGQYRASLKWTQAGRLLRKSTYTARPGVGHVKNLQDAVEAESILLDKTDRRIVLRRNASAAAAAGEEWKGEIRAGPADDWQPTPATFGLFFHETDAFSALLRRSRVRHLGSEVVLNTPCLKVAVDFYAGESDRWVSPLVLWLDESRGYYPIKFVLGIDASSQRYSSSYTFDLDGQQFKAKTLYTVEELRPIGPAWFPIRATMVTPFHQEAATTLHVAVRPESVRHGGEVESDLSLPTDVVRAVVRNELTGTTEVIGSKAGAISEQELTDVERRMLEHGAGIDRAPPPTDALWWQWIAAIVGGCAAGVFVAFLSRRRMKRA